MIKNRCKVTFVVHGSTIYTPENRLYEQGEYPPLDANGKYEISKLCQWLKKRSAKNDKVYSAPTLRAIQSAEIISKSFSQDFEILEGLTTKQEGILAGFSCEEIEAKYPDLLFQYKKNPGEFSCQGGESYEQYNAKMFEIIKDIQNRDFGKRIIIVGDANLIRGIISKAFEIPSTNQNKLNVQTGSASQINFYDGWETLVYLNYVPI